jgi:acid stress-induced BolA-like protein IbaG/YrbA
MDPKAVEALIRAGLPGAEVTVTGDGSHFDAVVISPEFAGKSPLAKQRLVLDSVSAEIKSGELHALSIKTFTPAEWAAQSA